METTPTNWSKEELKAYILLYCANANFNETKEEDELIKSRVGKQRFDKIHKEFDKDNDYQRITKIQDALSYHKYSKEQINLLLKDIEEVFFADGEFDILEKNLLLGLKHILK